MIGTQKIIFRDGELIPVADDVEGEEPLLFVNEKGYVVAFHPRRKIWISVHKIVDTFYNGPRASNIVIHHKDFNHQNNRIENLQRMDKVEHFLYHSNSSYWRTHKVTDAVKEKLRQRNIENWKNPEYRAAHTGINHPMYGKKHDAKTREQLRISHLGKKQSPEEIAKRVAKLTGMKRTPEQCIKMGEAIRKAFDEKGSREKIRLASIGKKHAPEQNARFGEISRRRWADPEFKKKMAKVHSEAMKKMWAKPGFRERRASLPRKPVTEETKMKIREGIKHRRPMTAEEIRHAADGNKRKWQDPTYKEKMRELHRKQWQDPAYRERMVNARHNRMKVNT